MATNKNMVRPVSQAMLDKLESEHSLSTLERAIYLLVACGCVTNLADLHELLAPSNLYGGRDNVNDALHELGIQGVVSATLSVED